MAKSASPATKKRLPLRVIGEKPSTKPVKVVVSGLGEDGERGGLRFNVYTKNLSETMSVIAEALEE